MSDIRLIKKVPWWPVLFLAVGLVFIIDPLVLGGHVPGNSGDSRFNLYVLEHFYQSLGGVSKNFTDAPFFYPWPATIGFSDTHWGTGFIYAIFRAAGLDATWAFSCWFVIGNLLNFFSCYYVFRKFGLKPLGASFGAFLYCFSLPVTSQFSHVQLVYRAGLPLAVLFLQRFLESRNPMHVALMVLFFCLQAAATFYLGIFLLLLLAGWVLGWLMMEHQQAKCTWAGSLKKLLPLKADQRSNLIALGILTCGAAMMALAIWPNLEASKLYGFKRGWYEIKMGLPQLGSYLQASHSNIWWRDHNKLPLLPLWWEQNLFPGLVMMVAVLASLRPRSWASNPIIFLSRTSLIFMLVATISLFDHSLYFFLGKAPGLDAIRAICRIILAMVFPAAYITGAFVEGIVNQQRFRRIGKILVMVAIFFTIYEASNITHQRDERSIWGNRVDDLDKELQKVHSGPLRTNNILVYTYPEKSIRAWWEFQNEIDVMLLSQKIGVTTLNGYSGNLPRGWKRLCNTDDLLDDLAAAQKFRMTHKLPTAVITPEDLIILGKGKIDPESLAEGLEFPVLNDGRVFTVLNDSKEIKRYFLNNGWDNIQGDRVMSHGDEASLIVRVPPQGQGGRKITIDLETSLKSSGANREVQIAANGVPILKTVFTPDSNRRDVELQIPEGVAAEYVLLTIKMLPPDLLSLWKSWTAGEKNHFALHGISSSVGKP